MLYPIIIEGQLLRELIKEFGIEKVFNTSRINTGKTTISNISRTNVNETFEEIMAEEIKAVKISRLPEFKIETTDEIPIFVPRYRLGKIEEDIVEAEIKRLLANGNIRKSCSPYSSPLVLAPKKNSSKRLCNDYRMLNDKTVKDAYHLPRIDDILFRLSKAKLFSILDAKSGYHQIPIREGDKKKTAFQAVSGLYEYNYLPFGLSNAPPVFQRVMDNVFEGCKGFCSVYIDDILYIRQTKKNILNIWK